MTDTLRNTICPHCGSDQSVTHSKTPLRKRCKKCKKTWRPNPQRIDVPKEDDQPALPPPDMDPPGFAEKSDDPNEAAVVSKPFRDPNNVPTIDSVLEEFGVDLEVWVTDNPVVNRWEMGFTNKEKVPGHYPLYQVKIPLQRRVPIGVDWPVFRGAVTRDLPAYRFNISRGLQRLMVMPDLQVGFRRSLSTGVLTPFHDPVACALFATVVKWIRPDGLISIGDNLDFTESTSKFLVEPEYYFTTQAALDWLSSYLWLLRPWVGPQESADEFIYLEGNHEKRLPVSIAQNSLFACRLRKADRERLTSRGPRTEDGRPILSVPGLLGLDDMLIRWVEGYPRNRWWVNDNLRATHSEKLGNKSGMSVSKSLDSARCSMIFGHSHRLESAHVTVHARDKERVYGAYNVGTLARVDGVVPSNAQEENWQQGFAIVDYQPNARHLHQVQLINIFGSSCIVEGTLFEPDDDLLATTLMQEELMA